MRNNGYAVSPGTHALFNLKYTSVSIVASIIATLCDCEGTCMWELKIQMSLL